MKMIYLKKEDYDWLQKKISEGTLFARYSNWLESDKTYDAFTQLSFHSESSLSDTLTKILTGEIKVVTMEKEYRIILEGLHRFEGVQTYSEYVYLKSDGTIAKTKSYDYITRIRESDLKELPDWAQALAKEVQYGTE